MPPAVSPPEPRRAGGSSRPVSAGRLLGVAVLVFAYFAVWALLRPPLQTPDEPQHLLKANAILLQPWRSAPGAFDVDPQRVNPLAWQTPGPIDKLFFTKVNAMTAEDIASTQRVPWPDRSGPPSRVPYARAIASYPSLYYLAVHAVAEPAIAALALSPWQATYAYRLVTALFAAVLWTAVWAALTRTADTAALATPMVAFIVANPMLAYISSGVTPDAVNNPLCALAMVFAWRTATPGASGAATGVVLLAAALTKPSGLQMAGVIAGALALFTAFGRLDRRRGLVAIGWSMAAGAASVLLFYLWSPPRFMAGGPSPDGLHAYLRTRVHAADLSWMELWGRLGWLDYALPYGWYLLLLVICAASAAAAIARPRRPARFAVYAAIVFLAFAGVTFAGEYHYLDVAGYTFQGRYQFPAFLGFAAVLWHERIALRRTVIACIVLVSLLLMQATVTRYYVDRWNGVRQAILK